MSADLDPNLELLKWATMRGHVAAREGHLHRTPGMGAVVGDVVRVDPIDVESGDSVLGWVSAIDQLLGVVTLNLVTPETEMHSEVDQRFSPPETGLEYDVIVLGDVLGHVWMFQIATILGHLPPSCFNSSRTSLPVRGQGDVRWPWKEIQLDLLTHLSSHCVNELMSAPPSPLIDPAILISRDMESLGSRVTQTLETIRMHLARIPMDGMLSVANSSEFRYAADVFTALGGAVSKNPSLAYWSSNRSSADVRNVLAGRAVGKSDPLIDVINDHVVQGSRCIRVLSCEEFWTSHHDGNDSFGVFGGNIGGARYQVVALPLTGKR